MCRQLISRYPLIFNSNVMAKRLSVRLHGNQLSKVLLAVNNSHANNPSARWPPIASERSFSMSHSVLSHVSRRQFSSSTPAANKPSFASRVSGAASFTFYSALVVAGVGLTGLVIYYFVCDILLPSSDVQVFNRAFSIIENDTDCVRALGGGRITAYGENVDNKWARNRPIASRRGFDRAGREHLFMQFHVKGDLDEGLVRLEMVQSDEKSALGVEHFDFRYLVLEVPGQPRVYVIDKTIKSKPKSDTGFLGVKWGPKKNDNE